MSDQRPDGLYECSSCLRTYDSEISLVFCCAPDEDQQRGIYRSSD